MDALGLFIRIVRTFEIIQVVSELFKTIDERLEYVVIVSFKQTVHGPGSVVSPINLVQCFGALTNVQVSQLSSQYTFLKLFALHSSRFDYIPWYIRQPRYIQPKMSSIQFR